MYQNATLSSQGSVGAFHNCYDPSVYAKLGDSNDMRGVAAVNEFKLRALGDIICDHGLEEVVGISLAHKHHSMSAQERLLWTSTDSEWAACPTRVEDTNISPLNWKVGKVGNNYYWFPLEFCPKNARHALEVSRAEMVTGNELFAQELKSLVVELGVFDIFGLGLLQVQPVFTQPGMTMFEVSNLAQRTTTARLIPESNIDSLSGGVTLWHFTKKGFGGNRQCAHGNSRHCCGN